MSQPGNGIPLNYLAHNARWESDLEHGPLPSMKWQLLVLTLLTSSIGENTPQPQPNRDQTSQRDASHSYGSESLFSMYIDRVLEEDNKMVESWKGDADGMLVFVSFQTTTSGASYV
jgi:hypothetical protein